MKILVTGATGNVGRLVVDELLALGATDVRALTNNPAKAALPDGVEVVEGFLGRPETLPAALAGVDRMYLAPLIRTNAEVCRMAADAGVRHIVDMAGAKGDHWQEIEDGVEACGVPWTHLEPGEFMTNSGIWAGADRRRRRGPRHLRRRGQRPDRAGGHRRGGRPDPARRRPRSAGRTS